MCSVLSECMLVGRNSETRNFFLMSKSVHNEIHQGRIEPPKAARGHTTSRSLCIDDIVLSVT